MRFYGQRTNLCKLSDNAYAEFLIAETPIKSEEQIKELIENTGEDKINLIEVEMKTVILGVSFFTNNQEPVRFISSQDFFYFIQKLENLKGNSLKLIDIKL